MSGILCRSCNINAVSIRCLHCMEDRALMCIGCARHHNEIKAFHLHELVPLGSSFLDQRGGDRDHTVQANANHLSSVMGNPSSFRPNSNPSLSMSQMAIAQREEAQRIPPAYRGLTQSRLGGPQQGHGQGMGGMGGGQGLGLNPNNPHNMGLNGMNGPGSYPSPNSIRNKVIHVTPATFHLIRSNALLLEDIKTCTGCKIFVSSASSHISVIASVNAVELVGTTVQIDGAIKCLEDLTSALNSSKRKPVSSSKFPGSDFPPDGNREFSPHNSPHLGPQVGPGQGMPPQGGFNPQRSHPGGPPGQGPGPWPPRTVPGEFGPQGYPPHLGLGQGPGQVPPGGQMNAREAMQAREQLQLQRLYAHSTGNVGGGSGGQPPHPIPGPSSRVGPGGQDSALGANTILTGNGPRPLSVTAPIGASGTRFPPGGPSNPPRPPGTGTPSTTTLSATATPFVFGQTSTLTLTAPVFVPTSSQSPISIPSTDTVASTITATTSANTALLNNTIPNLNAIPINDADTTSARPVTNEPGDPIYTPSSTDVVNDIGTVTTSNTNSSNVTAVPTAFEMGMTYEFDRELDGGTGSATPIISMTSGSAEETHEGAVAMSRRFLTGLDEDMNYCSGSDNYPSFDESYTAFDDESPSKAAVALGSLSLRSTSPENPVLGDSGWNVEREKDTFPAFPIPLNRPDIIPTLSGKIPVNISLTNAPASSTLLPVPVPIIITPTIIIPQSTARFTGFTAMPLEDDPLSNPFMTGGSSLSLPSTNPSTLLASSMVNSIIGNNNTSMYNTQGIGSDERSVPGPVQSSASPFIDPVIPLPIKFTESLPTNIVKEIVSPLPASTSRIDWPFSKIGLLQCPSGASMLKDIMENTHTEITVDFGGPPGLPRKVTITGVREENVGLANVLLSDVISTGSYVSFKESGGDISIPTPLMRDGREILGGSDVQYDKHNRSDSLASVGPDMSSLSFLHSGRDILGQGPGMSQGSSTSVLGSQREAEQQRERERFMNNSSFEFRNQFPGSQGEMEREREREKERAAIAGRFNPTMSSQSQGQGMLNAPGLQQQTSRYPRLFPSASGGTGSAVPVSRSPTSNPSTQTSGRYPVPGQGFSQGQGQVLGGGQGLGQGQGQSLRTPFERERGYDFDSNRGYDNGPNSLLGDGDEGLDSNRAESINRAIERANLSSGIIIGEIICPAEKVSLVIGTKGAIINEISRKSNTVINIVDEETRGPNSSYGNIPKGHRLILIRGSEEGVDIAKRYISTVMATGPGSVAGESQMVGSSSYLKTPGSNLASGQAPGGFHSSYGIQSQGQNFTQQGQAQQTLRGLNDGMVSGLGGLEGSRDRALQNPSSLSSGDYDSSTTISGGDRERDRDRQNIGLSVGEFLDTDRERSVPPPRLGPPGLNPNPLSTSVPQAMDETSQYWANNTHGQYGGTDGGRIAPPPHLSFTDMKNAGIRNDADQGNAAPDPNSRRSMARFQTYLDRTHAQQTILPPPSLSQSMASIRGTNSLIQERDRGSNRERERGQERDRDRDRGFNQSRTMTLIEVLDTLTCPLEKIPILLGHNGVTLRRIIDISGADIIVNHDLPPSMPRILELRGTEIQVKSARDLIESLLESEKGTNGTTQEGSLALITSDWNEEPLSPQDSHWMIMNAGYRGGERGSGIGNGNNNDRRDNEQDSSSHGNHSESKDKDEYEALYGKFILEDSSTSSSPTDRQAPPSFGHPPGLSSSISNSSTSFYYKNNTTSSVATNNNNNIDNDLYDDSESSDDDFEDSTSLTRSVKITSQNLVPILQGKLGILDKVANSTGTTVRLVSKKEYLRSHGQASSLSPGNESAPVSPGRGYGNGSLSKRNNFGSQSTDSNEMNSNLVTSVSTSSVASHIVIVSGLSAQDVVSGVAVMKNVLNYLSTQSVASGGYKAATALVIEHVSWPGDTVKDRTESRLSLLKEISTTSAAGVVLIKKFILKNTNNYTKEMKILPPPVFIPPAPISFADAVCKREKEAAAAASSSTIIPPPPVNILKEKEREKEKDTKPIFIYNHHVVLIGSRFRIAAARTLIDKIMNNPTSLEDQLSSASTSSTSSSVISVKGSSSLSGYGRLVHIPPPPRFSHEYESGNSSSEEETGYSDDDDSYNSNSGDEDGVNNSKQWNRNDTSKSNTKNNEKNSNRSEREKEKFSGRGEREREKDDDEANVICVLDCPNDKAGLVIGYKGSAIRTMSAKTRAKIVVTDATVTNGVSKRNVKIFGSRKQVDRARALVERLMEIGTDALDEDYSTVNIKREKDGGKDRDKDSNKDAGNNSILSELEFPSDVLLRFLIAKNQDQGVVKDINNRFFVFVAFPAISAISTHSEGLSSIVKMRGSRSQIERATIYLKRGIGAFKDRDREEKFDDKNMKRRRSREKGNDSDFSGDEGRRTFREDGKDREKDRKVAADENSSNIAWRSHTLTEKDRDREKEKAERAEDSHTVAVTVPCPASRAGCLIGSKGAIVKEIMRRTTARITISDEVILKLSPSALATNKDMTPDPTGYRWVTIKGGDDSVGAADALVRLVIEVGAKALNK